MKGGGRSVTHSSTSWLKAFCVCVKVDLNSVRAASSSLAAVRREETAGSRKSSTVDWRACREVLVESCTKRVHVHCVSVQV